MKPFFIALFVILSLQDSSPPMQLPSQITQVLDVKLPGWQWGTVSNYVRQFFQDHFKLPYPRFIIGDFDGDGRADYALKVTVSSHQSKADIIVAFLGSDSSFTYHMLDSSSSEPEIYVSLISKGSRLHNYETSENFTMINDGIGVSYFEKAGDTFIFKDRHFLAIPTSD
jgi:hypothetical protein